MIDTQQFPYDVLEEFGLTPEMIDDLPKHVIETLCSGGRSPLLPIIVKTEVGVIKTKAKFRLVESTTGNSKLNVIFYPQLSESPISEFSYEQQQELLAGQVIIADIENSRRNGEQSFTQCFVQIDRDTNHVFYVPTPVIGRNLQGIDEYLILSADDLHALKCGKLVTVDSPKLLTIGINLFTDTGIFVADGDVNNWHKIVGKPLPKYSFGVEGCWINEDGELHYVKEENFTNDIIEAQNELASQNMVSLDFIDSVDKQKVDFVDDINNQITR